MEVLEKHKLQFKLGYDRLSKEDFMTGTGFDSATTFFGLSLLDPWVELSLLLGVSLVAMSDFFRRFQSSLKNARRLESWEQLAKDPSAAESVNVSVIIPAYNEAVNIADCLEAVLANDLSNAVELQVIVADDESTDETASLAKEVAAGDDRALVFTVPPRPDDEVWRGKNWACDRAVEKATGDYLLFIDADVRIGPQTIVRAVRSAKKHNAGLLSCAPLIVYGCFAEWLVQPLMVNLIAIGFDFDAVNDPAQPETALAAGPFMLFRRSAYDKIGGHRAVADDAVEDLALAALIKENSLGLRYVLGLDAAEVQMYRSWSDLWEGWTKNYYLGTGRSIVLTVISAAAVFLIFSLPWLGLVAGLIGCLLDWTGPVPMVLGGLAVVWQMLLRTWSARSVDQSVRYLWLAWLAGGVVSAIALASIVKTETGWGWTWRGRSLAMPVKPNA
ncbi:MAG: glycosyltransferase family 2 protein [Cyanobacteria bacterium J06643_4]